MRSVRRDSVRCPQRIADTGLVKLPKPHHQWRLSSPAIGSSGSVLDAALGWRHGGWDDVRRIALALPETEERPSHGATRLGGCATSCSRGSGRCAERICEALGETAPDGADPRRSGSSTSWPRRRWSPLIREVYFTTPHFDGYAGRARRARVASRCPSSRRSSPRHGWCAPPRPWPALIARRRVRNPGGRC